MSQPASVLRPSADGKSHVGTRRYRLLKDAFHHAQHCHVDGRYLEVIPLLESIILDRLSSLVGGSLGRDIELKWTVGRFKQLADKNTVASNIAGGRGTKRPLPEDVLAFIQGDLDTWFQERNHAVHGMAKLHHVDDDTFAERYAKLRQVALRGFSVLLRLDAFDVREKGANGAGKSATWPDALDLAPAVRDQLAQIAALAS